MWRDFLNFLISVPRIINWLIEKNPLVCFILKMMERK